MEIITKLDQVWENSNVCPGCGSILGLKMLLQSLEDVKNVVIVTSPGEIASLKSLKVSLVVSNDPISMARGLARPDLKVIVYASTQGINMNAINARDNILCVCYNATCHVKNGKLAMKELAKQVASKTAYAATASIAYYEDFVAKLKKASMQGFKFIELFSPCPVSWRYDPSNTVEIGRVATESLLWPLYEVTSSVSVTKIPPHSESVQRYVAAIKADMSEAEMHALQEKANKSWKSLREGRLV